MEPAREELLLQWANGLQERLRSVSVPAVHDPRRQTRGIPSACVGRLTSFLSSTRDLGEFRRFLSRTDALDKLTAQNQRNPHKHHAVLRQEVEAFLGRHSDLTAEECLYVLSWVRRLLPAREAQQPKASQRTPGRRPVAAPVRNVPRPPPQPSAPVRETWPGARVTFDPGSGGILRAAASAAGKTAEARQQEASDLLATLSEDARGKLQRKKNRKPISADVDVEKIGTAWHLLAVREST